MAKIPEYPSLTAPNNNDLLVIEDSVTSSTKSITREDFLKGTPLPPDTVDAQAIENGEITGSKLSTSAIRLGYAQITSNFTTSSTTPVQITGLSVTVTVPAGGRSIKITGYAPAFYNSNASVGHFLTIWDGAVGSGTQIGRLALDQNTAGFQVSGACMAIVTPSSGSKTYNLGIQTSAGTVTYTASATAPSFLLVEAI